MTPGRKLSRRQWVLAAAGIAVTGAAADCFVIEPNRLIVTRHLAPQGTRQIAKVVQLTDLHLRRVGRHEHEVAHAAARESPNLIVITGDSVDRHDDLPLLSDFLSLLPRNVPKLAILGNWEYWAGLDRAAIEAVYGRHGCQLLVDESVLLSVRGATLRVTGFDSLIGGQPNIDRAFRGAAGGGAHLILAHCPAHRDLASQVATQTVVRGEFDPELLRSPVMLSGHTHGGQVNLWGWAPFVPVGSGRYLRGWYRDGSIALYVSRGIGMSVLPVRFNAPPEVAYFELSIS